jgi:alcohol dehydrogenase, propanol-preferring
MHAVQIERPGVLSSAERTRPEPGTNQILVGVDACGVCRTDLHLLDGEVEIGSPPVIPGHQIVGRVLEYGELSAEVDPPPIGARVGISWLGWTCGSCRYCLADLENLCERAQFTGRDIDGGFAELTVADVRYCFELPAGYSDLHAAPLLCAGLIGYRALRFSGQAERIGLYGFGASAHIVAQVAGSQGRHVFAFTRPGDESTQSFARGLGAVWADDSSQSPPEELEAAIIFAAAGELIPAALRATAKGGVVVCAGIHMSEIPSFPYEILWGERTVRSVANLTRRDAIEFLDFAEHTPIRTDVHPYPLAETGRALQDLRAGSLDGSAVIDIAGAGG